MARAAWLGIASLALAAMDAIRFEPASAAMPSAAPTTAARFFNPQQGSAWQTNTPAPANSQVTIEVHGVRPGAALHVDVVSAANGPKTLDSTGSLPADFMSDGKTADVYIDTCKDHVSVNIVEQGMLPPPEDTDCNRKIIEEALVWGGGRRLVIDAAKGVIVASPSASTSGTSGTRPDLPGERWVDVPAEAVGELVAGETPSDTGRPEQRGDLPAVQLRVGVVHPGGRLLGPNRNLYFSIGHRVAVGYEAFTGQPSSILISDSDWENDWIEVTETRVKPPARSLLDSGSLLPGTGAERGLLRMIATLGPALQQMLPRFARNKLMPRPAGVSGVSPDPFEKAPVEQGEQGEATITPPSFSDKIGSPRDDAANQLRFAAAARGLFDMMRPRVASSVRAAALPPGVRMVTRAGGRPEYWIEPAALSNQDPTAPARPSLKVFLQSLGRSTGDDAMQAIIINDGNVPVRLMEEEVFITEPLAGISQQTLTRELEKYAGRPRVTMKLPAYCLNYRKPPPSAGRVFRAAPRAVQAQAGPVRRILHAAERLRQSGRLHPDGDPTSYFHSMRQWAIWTKEQNFTEETFAQALLEHTRKNVLGAGKKWNREIEAAVRGLVPNRWRDVQRVLAESERFMPAAAR